MSAFTYNIIDSGRNIKGCESMLDDRDFNENLCCRISCIHVVIWVLSLIFSFAVGVIVGAFAFWFVLKSIVAIAIFAVILLIAIAIAVYLSRCRCRHR